MRRRSRLATTAAALVGGVLVITALTSLSSSSEGPLETMLERLAAGVASVEHRVRTRATGAGRARELAWFEPYRAAPDQLRHPSHVLLGVYDSGLPGTATGVVELERTLETTVPLMQIYTAWGDRPEHAFPLRAVTMIWTLGSVPVVTCAFRDDSSADHGFSRVAGSRGGDTCPASGRRSRSIVRTGSGRR